MASQFGVPYLRLRARWNARGSFLTRGLTSSKLDESQEVALRKWIDRYGSDVQLERSQVLRAVLGILQDTEPGSTMPDNRWLKRWLLHKIEYKGR